MRTFVGQIVAAVILAVGGAACWTLGTADQRVADAHQALATMRYAAVADSTGDPGQSLRLMPGAGGSITTAVHEDKSTAEYWLARYDALAPRTDAGGAVERDPEVLFVASNAAYRAVDLSAVDRQGVVRSIDAVIKSYADALKGGGGGEDAAFNYELLVRQRDAAARGIAAPAKSDLAAASSTHASIHGHQGGPPKSVDMSSFRIVIPKERGERQQEHEADPGKGEPKPRKG